MEGGGRRFTRGFRNLNIWDTFAVFVVYSSMSSAACGRDVCHTHLHAVSRPRNVVLCLVVTVFRVEQDRVSPVSSFVRTCCRLIRPQTPRTWKLTTAAPTRARRTPATTTSNMGPIGRVGGRVKTMKRVSKGYNGRKSSHDSRSVPARRSHAVSCGYRGWDVEDHASDCA